MTITSTESPITVNPTTRSTNMRLTNLQDLTATALLAALGSTTSKDTLFNYDADCYPLFTLVQIQTLLLLCNPVLPVPVPVPAPVPAPTLLSLPRMPAVLALLPLTTQPLLTSALSSFSTLNLNQIAWFPISHSSLRHVFFFQTLSTVTAFLFSTTYLQDFSADFHLFSSVYLQDFSAEFPLFPSAYLQDFSTEFRFIPSVPLPALPISSITITSISPRLLGRISFHSISSTACFAHFLYFHHEHISKTSLPNFVSFHQFHLLLCSLLLILLSLSHSSLSSSISPGLLCRFCLFLSVYVTSHSPSSQECCYMPSMMKIPMLASPLIPSKLHYYPLCIQFSWNG